jgi:hypothetical protein
MTTKYLLLALTATALLSVLGGCGSSSEEATAETTMPLKKYASKADLICAEAGAEQAELAYNYMEKNPNAEEIDLVIPAGVPPIEKEIEELHELGLPRGHEAKMEAFLREAEKALEILEKEPKGALSQKENPFKKANQLGEQLELGDCTGNP